MRGNPIPGSFRDPSGFLFVLEGLLYRRINYSYKDNYDHLVSSGLYGDLVERGLLIPHEEVTLDVQEASGAYKILKPEKVPFISYPYSWCFSQLKHAAQATLEIQKTALEYGMTLKDCSAYNIQFYKGRPVLIDTLSFEMYQEGQPWTPYKQFCQHFLAPLALMSLKDIRFYKMSRLDIDGVPLDFASTILPFRTHFSFPLLLHIHLHAKSQKHYSDKVVDKNKRTAKVSRSALLGLIGSLESAIAKLKWRPEGTEWVDYYQDDSYTDEALEHKMQLVNQYLDMQKPNIVWDLGANTGMYSRIASGKGAMTVSFDVDPACVEVSYLESVKRKETNILPLILDLTNPSPRIGWANEERMSIHDRGPADVVIALALIHHLAISNNVPLSKVASFFASICRALIVEFVPKSDAKVKKLLTTREDVFPNYTQQDFEESFGKIFEIQASNQIEHSERMLYLMTRR